MTAKCLLHDYPAGCFIPTIYEKKREVGGIWPISRYDHANHVSPDMRTNISKHMISFSDLAWNSVSLDDDEEQSDQEAPTFPAAHQVGKYLQTYCDKYLSPDHLKLNREVLHVACTDDPRPQYRVTSQAATGFEGSTVDLFDHVVLANGFFATPRLPIIPGLDLFKGPVIHTTHLRDIDGLLMKMGDHKKIVVVGASMSGGEMAAKLALHLSTLRHGAGRSSKSAVDFVIHNIASRPFWVVPPFVPADSVTNGVANPRPHFQPLDFVLADRDRRPTDQLDFLPSSNVSSPAAQKTNAFFQSLLGPDQADAQANSLGVPSSHFDKPPWVTISSQYVGFVHSGEIEPMVGRAVEMGDATVRVRQRADDQMVDIDDVGMLVLATGFAPHTALSCLSLEMRHALDHDPEDDYSPVRLFNFSTMNPAIPSLGFVGFYRGPYFGVLEQQARFLGALWSGSLSELPNQPPGVIENPEYRGQFPMGDYGGAMETLSNILDIERIALPSKHPPPRSIAIPALFMSKARRSNAEAIDEQNRTCEAVARSLDQASYFMGPAIFYAWQGRWSISREIHSAISSYPSGTFIGTAHMYPRHSTADQYAAEFLYTEEGELTTRTGQKFSGSRQYVYRLSHAEPQTITTWFVKADGHGRNVDYLFHTVHVIEEQEKKKPHALEVTGWRAQGTHHLCEADHYDTDYWFQFDGVAIQQWMVMYTVQGPSKDYWTYTTYRRG